jgi:hypothetical protein
MQGKKPSMLRKPALQVHLERPVKVVSDPVGPQEYQNKRMVSRRFASTIHNVSLYRNNTFSKNKTKTLTPSWTAGSG